jgi:chlorite dismutase
MKLKLTITGTFEVSDEEVAKIYDTDDPNKMAIKVIDKMRATDTRDDFRVEIEHIE